MPKANRGRRPSPTKHPSHASQNFTSPEKQQEVRDRVFQSVQEMFEGRIEPEVVYMVLAEFDWQEEKAIDSLFSLCGEDVDTEAKKNKLAEIAAQVFGILQSPEQNKFDRRDFPPLSNPFGQPYVSSDSTSVATESRSYSYNTTGNNSEFPPHSSVASSQSQKTQNSSDSLRSQLENIKSKHMKKSANKPTSMYASLLLATGEEGNQISNLQESYRTGIRETSLSPDSLPDRQSSGRSRNNTPVTRNNYGLRQQTVSPTNVSTVIGEELDVKKRHQSSEKGSNARQKKSSRSKTNSPSLEIKSEPVSMVTSNSGLTSIKGHNPLSSSILSTLQLSSSETSVSLENERSIDLKNNSSSLSSLSSQKSKTEINDDISEETFPDEESGVSVENQLNSNSLEHGYSHSFSDWHLSKGGNYVAFSSSYGLGADSRPSTSGTSLDSEDILDLNLNDLLSETCGISEENSIEKSMNYSPNVWSPSRSAETDADQKSKLGSRKSSKGEIKNENLVEEDSKVDINVYSTSAFSLEEIRNDAAFSFSVDAPVFVPRLPAKSPVEVPKPINAPSQGTRPQFMAPQLPIRPPQVPQNFVPKVIVQNMPQYGLQPLSFPAPVVRHPIGLVPVAKAAGPAVSVPINPLIPHFPPPPNTVPLSSQHPQFAFSAAAKKPAQANVQQRQPNKKNNANEKSVTPLDPYAISIRKEMKEGKKYLIIMRGLPGSGKSTLSRQLKEYGEVYSTDDYFMVGGEYLFDGSVLSEAHEWNRTRVKKALNNGINPVIVDNTHTQAWEIKPYVKYGDMYKYSIMMVEPDTKWKYNAKECSRKCAHKVPYDVIKSMLDRFEHNITVESIRKTLTVKEQDTNVNNVQDSVKDVPKERENKLTTFEADKDHDWTEDKEDFFMKDLKNCEESIDKFNEETFGSSGDEDEQDVSMDSSTSASNEAESAKTDKEITETSNTSSGKSTPKPLQPLAHMTDILSKRKFLVSPSFSVLGSSVVKATENIKTNSQMVSAQSSETVSQTMGHGNISSEVEEMVDDLIREHVVGQIASDSELNSILEELKGCLQLMPIESDQLSDVEKLIEQKLRSKCVVNTEDKTAGDLIELEMSRISEVGKNSSDGDSTVESLTPDSRVVVNDEQLVASFGDHLEDLNDKEINSITSNIEKKLFDEHQHDISDVKSENVSSKHNVTSDIDIENVMDHIERRLSDLGVSPSQMEDAVKAGLEKLSEPLNVHEQDLVQDSAASDKGPNQAMLTAKSEYGNSKQVTDSKDTQKEIDNQNSVEQDIECIQSENLALGDVRVIDKENFNTSNSPLCSHSESNNIPSSLSSSQLSDVADNNIIPLSDAEARYWGITKSDSSAENTTKWDEGEQITNPEIPKPRRIKHSSNSSNRKRNNSSKSDTERVTEDNVALVTESMGDEMKNNDKSSRLLASSDINLVSQQSRPQVINQFDSHETSRLDSASSDSHEISPPDGRPSDPQEITPSNSVLTASQESSSSDSREISPDNIDPTISQNEENEKNKTLSSGESATSSPKRKKKSSNRRKLAANFNVPFLDESFKESLKQDWNSLPSPTNGQQNKKEPLASVATESPVKDVVTKETEVSDEDLRVLNMVNNNNNVNDLESEDFAYKVISSRNISDIEQCSEVSNILPISPEKSTNQISPTNDKPAHVLMLDKSTSIEDVLTESGIDFMMNCFPSLGEEELTQVLEQCNYNVQWAVDLMLEWKYHLYLSPDVKHKFVDAMMKVHHVPKENVWTVPSSPTMISPDSLFDTCMSFIEKCGMSTRENLEKQIIQSGYSRLNSIENKIRQRMNSFEETSEMFIEDEYTESVLKEILNEESLRNLRDQEDDRDGINLSGIQPLPETEDIASESPINHLTLPYNDSVTSSLHEYRNDYNFGISENGIFKQDLTHSSSDKLFEPVRETPPVDGSSIDRDTPASPYPLQAESTSPEMIARSPDGLLLTLNIPKDFAQALLSLFGPVASFSPGNVDSVELPIDYRTAHAIHSCWKSNYKPTAVQKHHDERQLKKDEAYAMKLQLEEDYAELVRQEKSSPERLPSASLPRPSPQRVTDAGVYGKIHKPHAVSLIDIMNEEMEREVKKQNHLKALHASGTMTAVATKLKQQKLYEAFPGIDEQILDDIYEANSCNLEATIKAVKGSLANITDCPRTVLTAEAAEAYEMKLLDAAQQQSLQEMMDSYLYRPKLQVHKTVQQADKELLDPEEFRGEANIHYRLRHECFQKAQEAFSRGMKQVAVFYSEQGHQHTRKIKESNRRAAESILDQRSQQLEENSTLDLHGLHVDEAILALEKIIPQREIDIQTFPDKKKEHLIIITGRGNHSRGGIAKLRPAVLAFLNRNKYKYMEVHVGVVKVTLKYRQRN